MYILLESMTPHIDIASISMIDCMGAVKTEKEAIAWRGNNPDYREYKYISDDKVKNVITK